MLTLHELMFTSKQGFCHPITAKEDGLVDITGELTPEYILMAYRWGIFPWMHQDGCFFWFYVSPRLVLYPEKIHIRKSMRSYLNQEKFQVTYDRDFQRVIRTCKDIVRKKDEQSWIDEEFIRVYTAVHRLGYAHSVEVWEGNDLVGGLYGISIGQVFYGESMFALKSNASKYGLIKLAEYCAENNFYFIDCQQDTPHMRTMGAELISGSKFLNTLRKNMLNPDNPGSWEV